MAKADGLEAGQQRALDRLKPIGERVGLYLAGGTAIAFHLEHRISRDLDLFSREASLDLADVQEAVVGLPGVDVISLTDAMFRFRVAAVPVDVVRYRYPLLNSTVAGPRGFATASLEDLATMKLAAVARRGIRRDFWDLDEMFRQGSFTLEQALDSYVRRFGLKESDLYHVLRALTFFDDAERETTYPLGLGPERWQAIKVTLTEHAQRALRSYLGG